MRIPYPKFASAAALSERIDAYFNQPEKGEPITLTGLALHLGFSSMQQFEEYEVKGGYPADINRARLRIEQAYEKKLHQPSPSGSIFVLKSLGWTDKPEDKKPVKHPKTLRVIIVETGIKLASGEKEVDL